MKQFQARCFRFPEARRFGITRDQQSWHISPLYLTDLPNNFRAAGMLWQPKIAHQCVESGSGAGHSYRCGGSKCR
jgi:hypothetical protein